MSFSSPVQDILITRSERLPRSCRQRDESVSKHSGSCATSAAADYCAKDYKSPRKSQKRTTSGFKQSMKIVGSDSNVFLIGFDLPRETQHNSCLMCYLTLSCGEDSGSVWRKIINKAVRSLSPQGPSFVRTMAMLILYFRQLFSINVDVILSSHEVQPVRNCNQVLWCCLSLSLHPQQFSSKDPAAN